MATRKTDITTHVLAAFIVVIFNAIHTYFGNDIGGFFHATYNEWCAIALCYFLGEKT